MEVTELTVGTVLSTTIALLAPTELVEPGLAKVSVAWFEAKSSIEFKFSGIADKPELSSAI